MLHSRPQHLDEVAAVETQNHAYGQHAVNNILCLLGLVYTLRKVQPEGNARFIGNVAFQTGNRRETAASEGGGLHGSCNQDQATGDESF